MIEHVARIGGVTGYQVQIGVDLDGAALPVIAESLQDGQRQDVATERGDGLTGFNGLDRV